MYFSVHLGQHLFGLHREKVERKWRCFRSNDGLYRKNAIKIKKGVPDEEVVYY